MDEAKRRINAHVYETLKLNLQVGGLEGELEGAVEGLFVGSGVGDLDGPSPRLLLKLKIIWK